MKHIDHAADSIDGISAKATPEELRAEIAKRVALLRDKGYLDMDALPPRPRRMPLGATMARKASHQMSRLMV